MSAAPVANNRLRWAPGRAFGAGGGRETRLGSNVNTVVLTHLPSMPDENDDYVRFVPEVGKYFSGRVVVAKYLMAF
jgi:hypothetical protein